MTELFSRDVQEMIKMSREVALELGCNYVSTGHLLLADCRLNNVGSIKNFTFDSDKHFSDQYESCRIGDPITTSNSLPLTVDAEKIFKKAKVESFIYSEKMIFPCHVFLAAARLESQVFFSFFPDSDRLYDRLVGYYAGLNIINSRNAEGLVKNVVKRFL